jgi:hypothetical protein
VTATNLVKAELRQSGKQRMRQPHASYNPKPPSVPVGRCRRTSSVRSARISRQILNVRSMDSFSTASETASRASKVKTSTLRSGHPNSLKIGPATVDHHLEILLLNVFSPFA